MESENKLWGLLRRRELLVPTWRGWLALLVVFGACALFVARHAYSFLAVTESLPGGVLVVEGWVSDLVLEQAVAQFKRGAYDRIYVTGGPLETGAPLSEYHTYAERGAAILLKLGLTQNDVQAVRAPLVRVDRTYAAMIALRDWCQRHGTMPPRVNLITEGPHARRSRFLLQRALGERSQVGVTAIPPDDYDTKQWWRSSSGFRDVVGEALAYGYVVCFPPHLKPTPAS